MRQDGREQERKKQGPRESKDEVGEEEVDGERGRTLWIRGGGLVYAGSMGALRARVRYLAR